VPAIREPGNALRAVLASGGFHERLRARVLERDRLPERMVESLVLAIAEIPGDPQLSALV